jgi:hypothetical protein
MAQTKRRRRSKHRGTAAGTIESRGRTGRKPAGKEKAGAKPKTARERRMSRFDQPPTWRNALTRALLASAVFFALVTFALGQPLQAAIAATLLTLAVYIPLGYYTDLIVYRRRQRRRAGGDAKPGAGARGKR